MRKIVCLLVSVFILTLSSATFAANGYPDYLNGDKNYILYGGRMGSYKYLVRNSVNVRKYAPPEYIIEIESVTVPDADRGKTEIAERNIYRFKYDYNKRDMYIQTGYDEWLYLNPDETSTAKGMLDAKALGELAFYIAYRIPFCGKKFGFDSSFYKLI